MFDHTLLDVPNEPCRLLCSLLPLAFGLFFAAILQQRMFTTNDLMERWGVNRDTILHFIHTGRLRAINVSRSAGRASWRIPADAVETFEQANEAPEWNAPPRPKRSKRSKAVTEFF